MSHKADKNIKDIIENNDIKEYKQTGSMHDRIRQTIQAINNATISIYKNSEEANTLSKRILFLTVILTILTTISVIIFIFQLCQNCPH